MTIKPLQFGAYYHVYNRGNNRENLFVEQRNYPYFLKLLAKHILPVAEIFAYCLLPNHFHLLIRTYSEEEQVAKQLAKQIGPISEIGPIEPSRAFNNMFIAYTKAVNKATGRTGALFERPFGRKLVTNEAYFKTLIIYIHQNPQKHGFVDDYRDWKYASFGAFHSQQATNIERERVLSWFDGRADFAEAHESMVDERAIAGFVGDDEF